MQNLGATLEDLDPQVFDEVVSRLDAARSIYVIGLRSAAPLAQFLVNYLRYMFDSVRLITGGAADGMEEIVQLQSADVLIGISFPRYSARTLEIMRFARHCGAQVVAVTDGPMSPLHDSADICLSVRTDMASFVDSMAAPMSVINAMIVALGIKNREIVAERFKQLEEVWDAYSVYMNESK